MQATQIYRAPLDPADPFGIEAFCDDLEAYLETGVLPVRVATHSGTRVFHVASPRLVRTYDGEGKIAGKVVGATEGFEFMMGQDHTFSLLL